MLSVLSFIKRAAQNELITRRPFIKTLAVLWLFINAGDLYLYFYYQIIKKPSTQIKHWNKFMVECWAC